MASQKHQNKNKPSSARASVGSRDLVPVSQRSMASSGKLQSQSRSSTSAQLNLSNRSNAQSMQIYYSEKKSTTKISSSKQIVERVGSSSRGSQTTTKSSSSKQIVERVSCSSRGSQKTTTKISSSRQREERITANATRTQTHVKEQEMIRREHGSVVIDVRNCAEMQKKNYVSSKGYNVTQDEKLRIGLEFKLKIKH